MQNSRKSRKHNRDFSQMMTSMIFLTSVLVFAAGVGIFIYPALSNYLAEKDQKKIITEYAQDVEKMNDSEMERQWALAKRYNETLLGDPVHDPFVPGTGYALPDNYKEVLNVNGDGVMGHIKIPKIEVDLPIYHGTGEEELEKGAGHVDVTALPIGGEGIHPIISAHRGLPSAELFTRLDEMKRGDKFYIYVLDKVLAYEVDQVKVIKPEELESLAAIEGKDYMTLLTCTPYGKNTHRLLVRGCRIPYVEGMEQESSTPSDKGMQANKTWIKEYLLAILVGLVILLFIVIIIVSRRKKRKTHKRK